MTEAMKTNEEERGWQQLYGNMLFWEFDGLPSSDSVRSAVGFMERALELTQGASVLDLGCGLGYHAIELARRGYEVTGLDWSDQYLDVARSEAEEGGVAVTFVQGDMARMTFESEFDAAVLLSSEQRGGSLSCRAGGRENVAQPPSAVKSGLHNRGRLCYICREYFSEHPQLGYRGAVDTSGGRDSSSIGAP